MGLVRKDSSGAMCSVRQPASLALTTSPVLGLELTSPPRKVFATNDIEVHGAAWTCSVFGAGQADRQRAVDTLLTMAA